MRKRSALILVFLAMALVEVVVCVALFTAGVDDTAVALATIVILCVAADTSSRVIMRYGDKSSQR